MDKLPMCRICLVEDVHMYVLLNKDLHELYEKLTDVPFITEDSRPMLACFFCYAKLKQCWRLLRKCLEAEELFSQMMKEDYEADPLIKPRHLDFFNGLSNSPIVHISIVGGGQTESNAIKEELPDVNEGLDDTIDPSEELHTYKLELDNVDNSYPDVEDTPAHHAELDSEDIYLMEIKAELGDKQESIEASVAKKLQLDPQKPKLRDTISADQKKNNGKLSCASKIIMKTQNHTSNRTTKFKKPFTKTQHGVRSSINNTALSTGFRNNSNRDEIKRYRKVYVNEERFKCNICQRSFSKACNLVRHIHIHTGKTETQHGFNSRINNSALSTSCINNSNIDDAKRKISNKSIDSDDMKKYQRACVKEKRFKCDICQHSFSKKNDLTRHTRTHTGEKPFKCDVCQRSFNQKNHFVLHARIHTDWKSFKCDICQCSFNLKSSLLRHSRIHTGEKPFKCDICQRSFNQKNNLVRHTRTHTDENPLK